ncbi:MAG: hypothetical protein U1D55_05380 [Phycisphaerae bacterium]
MLCRFAIWSALVPAHAAFADVPRTIQFQGRLRTATGAPVSGMVAIEFRLYADSGANGTAPLFSELQPLVVVDQGLFSVAIGSVTAGGVPDAALNTPQTFLGVAVNGEPELQPRMPILSTPFALRTRSAEQLAAPGAASPSVSITPQGDVDVDASGLSVRRHSLAIVRFDSSQSGERMQVDADDVVVQDTLDATALYLKGRPLAAALANYNNDLRVTADSVVIRDSLDASTLAVGGRRLASVQGHYFDRVSLEADSVQVQDTLDATAVAVRGRAFVSAIVSYDDPWLQVDADSVTIRDTLDTSGLRVKGRPVFSLASALDQYRLDLVVDGATIADTLDATALAITGRRIAFASALGPYQTDEMRVEADHVTVSDTLDATILNLRGRRLASIILDSSDPAAPEQLALQTDVLTVNQRLDATSIQMPAGNLNVGGGTVSGPVTVIGDLHVQGTLTASDKQFNIDHPLDPANKQLRHSSVESDEMKNVYDGVVTLDDKGEAVIDMPAWFEALNRDFRYQLTCVGRWAPVYVAEEMRCNRFKIAGGAPGMRICWQVTGLRHDDYARSRPLLVEGARAAGGK